jgi:hypothetical protein
MTISQPQIPTSYRNLTLTPHVVDGTINLSPSLVSLFDQVVNMVTSLVEPVDQVVDPIPCLADPTLPLESETQVVDPFPPVDPILPLENATQVVNLISSSIDPTLLLESKPDTNHIFLIDTESTLLGDIPPSLVEPPPSNETILFNWGVLIGPRLPSHIPFHIIVQVCGRDNPRMLIDEGLSVSILSSLAWKSLGCPHLGPFMQNLLSFNRRTSQPVGTLP